MAFFFHHHSFNVFHIFFLPIKIEINFLNNKFGSEKVKEGEILSQIEKLNVKSGPTWLIIEKN